MNSCISGSPIRIRGTFKDFNGNLIDPDSVKCIIYDKAYKKLVEISAKKISIGIYECYYTTRFSTDKQTKYFCEMNGTLDGVPNVIRSSFMTRFA